MTEADAALDGPALFRDPSLFLRGIDFAARTATLTPMTREDYAAAIALDDGFEARGVARTVTLEALDRAVIAPDPFRRNLHFIFQKGYAGATLLSQVLGTVPGLFSLREPGVLDMLGRAARRVGRDADAIGESDWRWANTVNLHMMARTWHDQDYALVTAPAHCAEIMAGLAGWAPECRAVLLYVELEPFVAGALCDPDPAGFAEDVRTLYYPDFRDIVGDEAPPLEALTHAQQAAMTWLVHGCEYRRMVNDQAFQGRVLAADLDSVLSAPAHAMAQLCSFLQKPISVAAAERLAAPGGPMHRFAEAGDPLYGPDRLATLNAARAERGGEIEAALRWAAPWQAKLQL